MKGFIIRSIICFVIGALLIGFPLGAAGFSFIAPPQATTIEEAEALYAEGGLQREFREFQFETVLFTGLYLSVGEDETPTDWIMCGYFDGKLLPFYVTADERNAPQDFENVSYLLRRPSSGYDMHNEWVTASLIDEVMSDGTFTLDEASYAFSPAVLQAHRNGATVLAVMFFSGIAVLLLGALLLTIALRRSIKKPAPAIVLPTVPAPAEDAPATDSPAEKAAESEPEKETADFGFKQL